MGKAIQHAVDETGVVGPFNISQRQKAQQRMKGNIQKAIDAVKSDMDKEMMRRQQAIDSLEEYERVGEHCELAGQRALRNRKW